MFDSFQYSVHVQEKGRSGGEGCIGQRSVSIQTLDLVPAPHMLQHTAPRDVYHGHCQDMDTGDREQQVDIWTKVLLLIFYIVQIINPSVVVLFQDMSHEIYPLLSHLSSNSYQNVSLHQWWGQQEPNILFVISLYTVSWGRSLSNVASMFIATMCNDLFFHVSFNIGLNKILPTKQKFIYCTQEPTLLQIIQHNISYQAPSFMINKYFK